jgi:hypothetical protein
MNFKLNSLTTIPGALLFVGGIILFIIDRPVEAALAVTSGIGLLMSKASNVTGVGDDAKTKKQIEEDI